MFSLSQARTVWRNACCSEVSEKSISPPEVGRCEAAERWFILGTLLGRSQGDILHLRGRDLARASPFTRRDARPLRRPVGRRCHASVLVAPARGGAGVAPRRDPRRRARGVGGSRGQRLRRRRNPRVRRRRPGGAHGLAHRHGPRGRHPRRRARRAGRRGRRVGGAPHGAGAATRGGGDPDRRRGLDRRRPPHPRRLRGAGRPRRDHTDGAAPRRFPGRRRVRAEGARARRQARRRQERHQRRRGPRPPGRDEHRARARRAGPRAARARSGDAGGARPPLGLARAPRGPPPRDRSRDPADVGDRAGDLFGTGPGRDRAGVRDTRRGLDAPVFRRGPRRPEPRGDHRRGDDLHSVQGRTEPPRGRDERLGRDRARRQRPAAHAPRARGVAHPVRTPGAPVTSGVVSRRTSGRPAVRSALGALVLTLGGCAWDTPMTTLIARSDFGREILHVYAIIAWATAGIALVVFGVLAWVLVHFRATPGAPLPAQTRGPTLLEIAWTIAPALVLLVISVPTLHVIFRTQAAPPAQALEVTLLGRQWWWEFRYPTLNIATANELHLPAGRPAALRLEGPDVIHSFWVPQLGGKRDVVPGRSNQLTFTPQVPGEYWGQCAEFCGVSHANMRLRVIVDTPEAFARWVAAQRVTPAPPSGLAAEGKTLYASRGCVGCHTIRGVSAGVLGPDLTTFGSRRTLAAGMFPNTPERVAEWVKNPGGLKPGVKMPALGLTDDQARAVAAYLASLK